MKLHLPTTLRAALIAAMVLCSVPSAYAEEFDPSAAQYASGYIAYSGHDELDEASKNESYRRIIPWDDLVHVEIAESWGLTLHGEGWSASNGNFVLGWTTDYAKANDALGKDELTVTMTDGFVVALTGGKAIVATPSADGKDFKGPAFRYKQGVIADLRKTSKNITLDLNFFYDGATQTLTLNSGSFTLSGGTVVEVTEQSWHAPMPGPGYFLSAGLSNSDGASSDWSFYVPSDTIRQWDISGLTSLDKMKAGDTYLDTETGTTRALDNSDLVNFAGGVIFAETSQSLSTTFTAGNTPSAFGKTNMVGLGAAEGQTLTVTSGLSALTAAAADGLNIIGGGEVELQLGTAGISTTKLIIADGSTLSLTGNHFTQTLDMTGATTSADSTIRAEGGLELHNADAGTIALKEVACTAANHSLNLNGGGTFAVTTVKAAGAVIGGTDDKTTLIVNDLNSTGSLEVAKTAVVTATNATLANAKVRGTMTAANLSGNSLSVDEMTTGYVNIRKQTTATAFTATNFAAQGSAHAFTADHVKDAIIAPAPGGTATIKTAENTSVLHGMDIAIHAANLTGGLTVTAEDITVDGTYTSRILAEMGDVTSTGIKLTKKSEAKADSVTLTGNALELTGASRMDIGTLTAESGTSVALTGGSCLNTETATMDMLTMSGEGSALAAKHLELGVGNITTDSSATVAMEDVVMEDALLTTTGATTSGITGATPGAGTLAVGSGYTFTGVTSNGNPAALDVMQVSLADNATLQNFAVGAATTISAAGTQHLDNVKFAGGYNKMSFGGTPYFTVSDTFSNGSTLDSVAITGTTGADTLAADFITINGEDLLFESTGNDYTLFTTGDGVTLDFDAADVDKRQFNITPYTIASLTVENGGRELVIHGREAKAEIMDALRSTPNRAAAMDNLAAAMQEGAAGQLVNLFNYVGDVYHPTMDQRQSALSAASGASLANLSDAQRRGIEDVQQNLRNRIVQMGGHGEGVLRGGWDHADIQAWVQADGAYHTLGQNGDKAGYDTSVYGATAGANLDLNEHWTVGAALSVENGSLKGKGDDHLDADTLSCYVNLFGRYQKGHWTHLGIFTIGMDDVDTKRTVLGMKGDGSTSGTSFSAYYELGYIFTLDDDARRILQPIINVSLTSAKMGSFTESGSIGSAGLKYDANNLFYGNVGIGARYQAVLSQSVYERNTVLELRAQLNEHFGNATDEADLTFIGGGNQFTAKGADSGNFGVQLGTGLSVPVGLQTTLFGDADAEFRAHQTDFRANIGVRYDF